MIGIGNRLRDLRAIRNLSQAEVARQLNIAYSTMAGYELSTSYPSLEKLCSLANFYNVTTDYILGREKDKKISFSSAEVTPEQIEIINLLLDNFKYLNKQIKDNKK